MSFSYKIYNPNNIIINTRENYHIVPFGHRCSSALVAKYASLRKCSLPFDWCRPLFPQNIPKLTILYFFNFHQEIISKN